jgi:hypothetical protein
MEKAEIKKTENMQGVIISSGSMTALIPIDKNNRKAVLSHREKKEYEFVVRELTDGQFAVDILMDQQLEDWYMEVFIIYYTACFCIIVSVWFSFSCSYCYCFGSLDNISCIIPNFQVVFVQE